MIGGRKPLQGRKVADRRVRVERPHSAYFRYTGPGMLTAKAAASLAPRASRGPGETLRRFLFGRRLSNEEEAFERLPKKLALPIFSSDAISSSAYATEEILRVFVVAGAGALLVSIQMSMAIIVLLVVVSVSYRQVCRAYPSGGGAYAVARENISQLAGLIAAAALLIDYVMTVAVSTASAVAQVYSVVPALYDIRIEIALGSIALITIANLRGLREAGLLFASPTYIFVGLTFLVIGLGIFRIATGQGAVSAPPADQLLPLGTEPLGMLLILRAFAAGSVALTGVEAIANGVPAFKPPEAKNAANTMTSMAILLGVLFIGITIVADGFGIRPTMEGGPTVIAMVVGRGLRRWLDPVRPVPGGDRPDPVPGGEHQLQRVPAARGHPGPGRVHAAPVRVPGRPPRVLVGDRGPGVGRGAHPHRVQRRHARPHPALLGGGLRLLHALPGGNGPALVHGPGAGLALAGRDQRPGRVDDASSSWRSSPA